MKLRLTLVDPRRTAARVDVVIEAAPGTPFAAVSTQLATVLGATVAAGFSCEREPVDGSAPLGLPPLVQGAVLALTGDRVPAPAEPPVPLLAAHVVAGPDAGTIVPLGLGQHGVGRGPEQAIRLTDPDVSRAHAELTVSAAGADLRDLGSTNGTWLAGRRLGRDREPCRLGDQIRVGSGRITLRRPDRPPAATTLDGAGHLRVNRAPRLRAEPAAPQIRFPAEPEERPRPRLPWPTMLLPLLLAVPLALLWRQPTFLLFALMTPLLIAAQYATDRRAGRREATERRTRHATIVAHRQQELELAIATDAARLEAERPDLARLAVTAGTPTDELWHRSRVDPDFLSLRLGRGPEASRIGVLRPGDDLTAGSGPEPVVHPDVPIAVELGAVRVLGLCGPRPALLGLARSLLGQLAVLHSPLEVGLEILVSDPDAERDWQWARWLPHHEPGGAAGTAAGRPGRRQVVVLDGAHTLRRRGSVAAVLGAALEGRTGSDTGRAPPPLVVCLDRAEPDLPVECRATITLAESDERVGGPSDPVGTGGSVGTGGTGGTGGSGALSRAGAPRAQFVPDLATELWAERLARDLAPLRDATCAPDADLPAAVRLVDLLAGDNGDGSGVRARDPDDLARHWQRTGEADPTAVLGLTAAGPFRIDLRRDGPHLLVAGTTGAGKSQLLQTLVTALAVDNAPDTVSFLLIDYKGGAAFRDCAQLPHVGGVITDLDPLLAGRALTSLTAELRRRERLLTLLPAVDIDGYRSGRATRPDLPALPRLVVIVDEFRVLAEDLPDFVSGLVRTATVGRSLGVHLVLATQRPSGVVSAEITANVNLRIALRLNDGADSRDLIDDPAAAGLPADRPGRALARVGAGPLVSFQTATVSGIGLDQEHRPPSVTRLDLDPWANPGRSVPARSAAPGGREPSDLLRIAAAAGAAAIRLGLPPARPPWLDPLPPVLPLDELLGPASTAGPGAGPAPGTGGARAGPGPLPFARVDLPAEQQQVTLSWRLGGTHLAICGGPRSGRSTTLQSLARAAGALTRPGDLRLYVVDAAAALSGLVALPVVEAVIAAPDTERAERLLRLLVAEIEARRGWGAGHPASPGAGPDPGIVLLIDGWEGLTAAWEPVDHGRLIDQLIAILRDGPAVGVHAAISGGRALLTGTVSALLAERVLLRFADPADAALAGVPSARLPITAPAGRGLVIGPRFPAAVEIQVGIGGPIGPPADGLAESEPARPAREIEGSSPVSRPPAGQRSWRIPELPRRLDHHRLISAWNRGPGGEPERCPGRRLVPVGIGGDEAVALALDLDATAVSVVAGPPGSGRTSVLRCVADGLTRLGEAVLWVSLADPPPIPALAAALTARPGATVLVDDTQASNRNGPLADELQDRLAAHASTGRLVLTATTTDLLGAYRGLLTLARPVRYGLLLGTCGPGDADVFALPALNQQRRPPGPPGRALLIQAGRAVSVQLALPPPRAAPITIR